MFEWENFQKIRLVWPKNWNCRCNFFFQKNISCIKSKYKTLESRISKYFFFLHSLLKFHRKKTHWRDCLSITTRFRTNLNSRIQSPILNLLILKEYSQPFPQVLATNAPLRTKLVAKNGNGNHLWARFSITSEKYWRDKWQNIKWNFIIIIRISKKMFVSTIISISFCSTFWPTRTIKTPVCSTSAF